MLGKKAHQQMSSRPSLSVLSNVVCYKRLRQFPVQLLYDIESVKHHAVSGGIGVPTNDLIAAIGPSDSFGPDEGSLPMERLTQL